VIPLDGSTSARCASALAWPLDRPVIALLPGSRQSELHFMAETFIETAKLLLALSRLQFLVPLVSRETRLQFETRCGS
jgi:lipid-A-disaccharide synthase